MANSRSKAATESTAEPVEIQCGEIIDVTRGHLVRRPDGTVATAGGPYSLNAVGEFAVIDAKGVETIYNVVPRSDDES